VDARQPTADYALARPSGALAPYIGRWAGYRLAGFTPGIHLGMPSGYLTIVISLGEPTQVATARAPAEPAGFQTLVGGLHTRPALISHDGNQHGIELSLTPAAARALLGLPAGELTAEVIDLAELIPGVSGLAEEFSEWPVRDGRTARWERPFAALYELLVRQLGRRGPAGPELAYAWDRIAGSGGTVRIGELAGEVGWSRRHLAQRFRAEYGMTPKDAARLTRFHRARTLLGQPNRPTLADVASQCGYADQAHLTREWNEFAGCPPSVWLASDDLPFVQDDAGRLVPV
jgi:AraC-like DNA-binding protein